MRCEEEIHEEDHPDILTSLHNLALACEKVEQYEEAKNYLERALVISEKINGVEHPNVAKILNDLGRVYYNLNKYLESNTLFERALIIYKKNSIQNK